MSSDKTQLPSILHLARWYPNRYDPMFGLFVRRHLEAAAQYSRVTLVYVHPVTPTADYTYEIVINEEPFTEIIVYYAVSPSVLPHIKLIRFFSALRLGIGAAKKRSGTFDRTHVHILTRLGVVALLLRYMWGIPYVVTEHWSRYQSVTGNYKGWLRKRITKLVVRKATVVTTPSRHLSRAMKQHGLHNNYRILPNVINPVFFKTYPVSYDQKFRFVHVSCFEDRSKNISGILKAVDAIGKKRDDFIVTMIGAGQDLEQMKKLAAELHIPADRLVFTGLLQGEALAREMAQNNALILFSNYENMPVVINESFALGIPVIATAVGGIPEVVNEKKGVLIPAGDVGALVDAMQQFIDGRYTFDKEYLKSYARNNFSYHAVGKQIVSLYS